MNLARGRGGWNAFVVFDCATAEESRKRLQEVPDQFKQEAESHARTYWLIQGDQRPPKSTGFAGMSEPFQGWPLVEITPEHWAAGKAHLKGSNWQHMRKFGDQVLGFTAEYAVADWFSSKGVVHNHNPDPTNTEPDFSIQGLMVDLKSVSTVGPPRKNYDADLAEHQRLKDDGKIDWYMFGKHDNTNTSDYYILGFQTEKVLLEVGAFYQEGEITRKGMNVQVDCWCIEYWRLVKPLDWLSRL